MLVTAEIKLVIIRDIFKRSKSSHSRGFLTIACD